MEWLNYHHLLYFWMVAREGGIARASAKLRLAHPTVSGQVIGRASDVRERFYAISVERRVKHPAVAAILATAREELFR